MLHNECTVVTAFYDFKKKKFSSNNYYEWMKNFLSIPCKMIIFVGDQTIYNKVSQYRDMYKDITQIFVLPIENLHCYKMMDYWEKDYERDHERYHDPYLYIIWNEKTAFLKKAKDMNIFETEFYCWADIGMVRNTADLYHMQNFPSTKVLNICDKRKIHLLEVNPFTEQEKASITDACEEFRYNKDRIGGGVILCHNDMVDTWYTLYYKMLSRFMELDLFAGKDQSIMNCLYMQNKNLIKLISPINSPIDPWFYMLHYFSESYYEKNSSNIYTALIIEPRKHFALEYVLNNFTKNLNHEWQFVILHGNNNEDFVKNITDKIPNKKITLINLKVDNLTTAEYNALFYDKSFYNYIPTEMFLVFQTDTLICEKYKDRINDFLKYDYVGSPWRNGNVGNGGFSLRRKCKMLDVLDKCSHLKMYTSTQLWNEDAYFSEKINDEYELYKPSFEEAKKFGMETVFSNDVFGIHNCWKWLRQDELSKTFEYFPELKGLIGLYYYL